MFIKVFGKLDGDSKKRFFRFDFESVLTKFKQEDGYVVVLPGGKRITSIDLNDLNNLKFALMLDEN